MCIYDLEPTKPYKSNQKWQGYQTNSPVVAGGAVQDLQTYNDNHAIWSVWKFRNWKSRVRVLFTGKVSVGMLGQKLSPLSVIAGDNTKAYDQK